MLIKSVYLSDNQLFKVVIKSYGGDIHNEFMFARIGDGQFDGEFKESSGFDFHAGTQTDIDIGIDLTAGINALGIWIK